MKNKIQKDEMEELRIVTIRLPQYQYQYLMQMSELTGVTMAETIRQLVDIYIETV